jgi:hypothetical protein
VTPTVAVEECDRVPLELVTVMLYKPDSVRLVVLTIIPYEGDPGSDAFKLTLEELNETLGAEAIMG